MPFSSEALQGLETAARWNPHGARELLSILRETPQWVKYKKDDLYGPLGLVLFGVMPQRDLGNGISIPVKKQPLAPEALRLCEIFGEEWLQKRFSLAELADTIESILTT